MEVVYHPSLAVGSISAKSIPRMDLSLEMLVGDDRLELPTLSV